MSTKLLATVALICMTSVSGESEGLCPVYNADKTRRRSDAPDKTVGQCCGTEVTEDEGSDCSYLEGAGRRKVCGNCVWNYAASKCGNDTDNVPYADCQDACMTKGEKACDGAIDAAMGVGTADEGTQVCFPASAMVATVGDGVAVGDLRRGAQLLSPWPESGAVTIADYMTDAHEDDLGHRMRNLEFLQLTHELMPQGRPLKITSEHFLHKANQGGEPVLARAGDVHIGDFIFALVGEQSLMQLQRSRVTNVTVIQAMGVFSPQTTSGRLIVDGVAVSAFAVTSKAVAKVYKAAPSAIESLFKFWLLPTRFFYELNLPFTGQVDLLEWLPKVSLLSVDSDTAPPQHESSTTMAQSAAEVVKFAVCTESQNME